MQCPQCACKLQLKPFFNWSFTSLCPCCNQKLELSSNVNLSVAFSVILTSLSPIFVRFSDDAAVAIAEVVGLVFAVQLFFLLVFAKVNAKQKTEDVR